jgi:hypothetical protein
MPNDPYDILRRAVIEALGARPNPERRRKVAADLRALAEQQERMAASAEVDRAGRTEAGKSKAQRGDQPAQQRPPGMYIRIGHEQDPHTGAVRLRVSLGRQIWADIGGPDRVDMQRVDSDIWIVPAADNAGYALNTGDYLPNCLLNSAGLLAGLGPGRYAARIHAGAIVIGERLG